MINGDKIERINKKNTANNFNYFFQNIGPPPPPANIPQQQKTLKHS